MAIPGPGTAISMTTIATEFNGTTPYSISQYYRGGGKVPNTPVNVNVPTSGTISLGNFYGSANSNIVTITLSSNVYNYNLYANRGPTYIAGSTIVNLNIPGSVLVGSTSTGASALTVSGFAAGDVVTVSNSGKILGMGGGGGPGGGGASNPGAPGGNALAAGPGGSLRVVNTGTIGGGGGGGGSSPPGPVKSPVAGGGGGGAGFNGGAGGSAPSSGAPGNSTSGGAGGVPGGGPGGGLGASGTGGSGGTGGGGGGSAVNGNTFLTWPSGYGTTFGSINP